MTYGNGCDRPSASLFLSFSLLLHFLSVSIVMMRRCDGLFRVGPSSSIRLDPRRGRIEKCTRHVVLPPTSTPRSIHTSVVGARLGFFFFFPSDLARATFVVVRIGSIDRSAPRLVQTMLFAALAMRGHSSAHSLATGPVMAEPFISPLGLTMTPALSSKYTYNPSFLRHGLRWRITTAGMTVAKRTCVGQRPSPRPAHPWAAIHPFTHLSSVGRVFLS